MCQPPFICAVLSPVVRFSFFPLTNTHPNSQKPTGEGFGAFSFASTTMFPYKSVCGFQCPFATLPNLRIVISKFSCNINGTFPNSY